MSLYGSTSAASGDRAVGFRKRVALGAYMREGTVPVQSLDRGHVMNLGAGIVAGNITLNGVAANYSVTIGANPPAIGVAQAGHPVVFPVNNLAVSVTNTTPPPGPPNLNVTW
jgi:hypothetical protein